MTSKIRLYKAVIEYLKDKPDLDYTNPEVQRNIENFGVLVDDQLIKNRLYWYYPGQIIRISNWIQRSHGNFDEVVILEDQDDYLVLFKPAGVVVQAGAGHQSQNLQKWLENKYNQKMYLVHRLDKDTQGILLVAKSEFAQTFFQNQFRNRSITKKYLAVVEKAVDNLWIIQNWQSRDKINPTRQKLFWTKDSAQNYDPSYRQSESNIRPLFYCKNLDQTLIEIEIKTGRMHQIRLQCEALGFPLVQEKLYNHKYDLPKNLDNLKQLALEKPVDNLSIDEFNQYKTNIFGELQYCLLSNYLKIQKINGDLLEMEYKKSPYL